MTLKDFNSHPAADRRTFDCLPVQICGAYEQTRSEDGKGMDLFQNIQAARNSYPDLPNPDGWTPASMVCKRFFGPIPHVIEGQLVIRYESLAAHLRCKGHRFHDVDDFVAQLAARGEETEILAYFARNC